MTEEEARKKVCKQIPVFDELGILRGADRILCIASDCMKWRWGKQEEIEIDRGYSQPPDIDVVDSGFCGRGGKP